MTRYWKSSKDHERMLVECWGQIPITLLNNVGVGELLEHTSNRNQYQGTRSEDVNKRGRLQGETIFCSDNRRLKWPVSCTE